MAVIRFQALACPLDGQPLNEEGASWRCVGGHSFDVARQGHTHLLPVQNKRSREPGDGREMVAARQQFLNAGFYQPIADAVNRQALADLPATKTVSCLDAGCGEGYYMRQLIAAIDDQNTWAMLGLDISKWAILSAAKKNKQVRWVVGSNANLPVQDETVDRLLCVFGFPVYAEFARVLKSGGLLIQVDSGADHLRELREVIYPSVKPDGENKLVVPEGYTSVSDENVRYPLELTKDDQVASLLAMTPHLYRANAEGRARAAALTELKVTVDVNLNCFKKC